MTALTPRYGENFCTVVGMAARWAAEADEPRPPYPSAAGYLHIYLSCPLVWMRSDNIPCVRRRADVNGRRLAGE